MENPIQTPVPVPAPKNNLLIPLAIVIAGVAIAGALFITRGDQQPTTQRPKNEHLEKNLAALTATDHVRGSSTAPVVMIEFSDTDCPYCKAFMSVLQDEVNKYQSTGSVAWVYRHFAFHTNAPKEAEATECVAEIGGNEKFWEYLDLLFSKKDFTKQPYKPLDPSQLPILAASIGINKTQFTKCLNAGTYKTKVADQSQNAVDSGASGTPFTIIISKAEINKAVRKFVEDTNNQILSQNPTYPDVLFISPDKRKVVVGGAMPSTVMSELLQLLVANNK